MKIDTNNLEKPFEYRHIGPSLQEISEMLDFMGVETVDRLIEQTIPGQIRLKESLDIPGAVGEHAFLEEFKRIMDSNRMVKNFIGMGYYPCFTPAVIQRNILENPGWYTAYTPYQAEIAQGRLEALVNFQTMVIDLTGMEVANASLLDEGTAAAEAMSMFYSKRKGDRKEANRFFIDRDSFPQTIDVLKTRAGSIGIELIIGSTDNLDLTNTSIFGIFLQYPNNNGEVTDPSLLLENAQKWGVYSVVAADLMSLVLLTPPGEMGADAVVGTTQRMGIPMGYGGPHAAYFATRSEFKRQMPGRIIGLSQDAAGNPAYRMALQTREQHIRREKATSNICTAQVLLAVMSGMYAVYHGPKGLKAIASRINAFSHLLHQAVENLGFTQVNKNYFDTLKIRVEGADKLRSVASKAGMNIRIFGPRHIGISLDETTSLEDVRKLIAVLAEFSGKDLGETDPLAGLNLSTSDWPVRLVRTTSFLDHPVFHKYHAEHELLRYMKHLENKDLSLVHSMISLGSCTMKLNGTAEMVPVTWPELGQIHPFAPSDQCRGYEQMITRLGEWLAAITGFHSVSMQPNSGAQGEYAGLMVIRAFHHHRGDGHRNVALIPSSAHGTNPASAVMAGYDVVIVQCDEQGNIDLGDLKEKAEKYSTHLAALMITYPSTHGVFEEDIKEICTVIHSHGGQVYMDGANMNAQVGLTNPAIIGADVCHLNLHKTFCIPHGGGGPGMGPIGVAEHLAPFLPGNPVIRTGGSEAITAVSAAPYGSASILAISYAYIAMMGAGGLKRATEIAILNANYIKERIAGHFDILYTGKHGRCAHELIIDCRAFKKNGIGVQDIAKRLMDYGYHAPTVSFPVAGTMMIEPTESETKEEMDRFCDSLIAIRGEIREIENGAVSKDNNVLVHAPHTFHTATADSWDYPYSRQKAVFPLPFVKARKFWPSVSRVDDAYGDRNLVCTCLPIEAYEHVEA